MRCFVVAGFLLTSASRSPSTIAQLLVITVHDLDAIALVVLIIRLFLAVFGVKKWEMESF